MNAAGTTKIIYCGLDLKAWDILSRSDRFDVVAVNKIGDFLDHSTFNPVDGLFKIIYSLRCSQSNPSMEKALSALYRGISFLSSGLYRRYASYLQHLCLKKIPVLDFDDVQKFEAFVHDNNIPLMVVNNWWMLPDKIIHAPARGTVNIHPSRLPQYRGSLPTLWSLKNNDKETAVSFILLARKMDSGNVIAQYPIAVGPTEDAVSLEGKIEQLLAAQLEKTLEDYLENKSAPIPQNNELASTTARYFDYMPIDWEKEKARDIADKINLYPYLWPPHRCWAFWGKRKVTIRKAAVYSGDSGFLPDAAGSFRIRGLFLYVRGADGIIRMQLFKDVALMPGITLMLKRQGKFGEEK